MSKTPNKNNDTIWSPMVKIVALVCALVLIASIALAVVAKTGVFRRNTVVMTVGDSEISALEFNHGYYSALNDFYSQYYYYASMIGFDTSTSLKSQTCYFDSSMSWYEYFVNQTKIQLEEVYLLYNKAMDSGFEMTEESKKSFDESISAIEKAAEDADMKVNEYLRSVYGPNITMDDYKEFVTRRLISADYYEQYMDGLEYADDKIEAYYKEHTSQFDVVDYYEYKAKADTTNNKSAEEVANAIKDAANAGVDSFIEAIKAYENADTFKAETYLKEDATYNEDDDTSKWLFEDGRKNGDVTVIKTKATSASSSDTFTVICFVERGRETYQLATMRHILFTVEELTDDNGNSIKNDDGEIQTDDAEKKAAAEKLLKEWKDGEATEKSFGALVKDNSDDEGSVNNEGLYEDFDKNTMVSEITDWIWAEGRKTGDCEIVKTSYGYHIVYFVGYGDEKWNADVVSTLKGEDYEAYLKDLRETYKMSFNDKGLSQVG